ncbi:MAG: metal ABC transporter permease [Proteobacteria bacterium]|nr:metal ABC transporter permease [Pseudomonadota bacterium]
MNMLDFLNHGFVQKALIAGSFIAILCSTLGVFLVLRRLSLIGDGLAHVTFGSIAVGLFFKSSPVYVAVPIVMLSSLGILKLVEKARIYGDAAIGIVSSLGIAAGVMMASIAGGFNVDLFSYLFGNILSISIEEVIASIVLSIILITVILLFYQELLSVTFDEESAKASGVNTKRINSILVLLTALTVVLAMKMVGIMLVSALLIIPSVTALQMARSFRSTMFIASIAGVLSVVIGICISFAADLPTGATIVLLNILFFICAFIYKTLRS